MRHLWATERPSGTKTSVGPNTTVWQREASNNKRKMQRNSRAQADQQIIVGSRTAHQPSVAPTASTTNPAQHQPHRPSTQPNKSLRTLNTTTEPSTCVHLGVAAHLPLLANLRNVPFMFLKATAVSRVWRRRSPLLKVTSLENGPLWPHPSQPRKCFRILGRAVVLRRMPSSISDEASR